MNSDLSIQTRRRIAVMGSTGSIGTQTLDIIAEYPDLFEAVLLTANSNWKLLAAQALRFHPKRVVIADPAYFDDLKNVLDGTDIIVEAGPEALADAAEMPEADTVVAALVGYSGLLPTVRAIKAGKTIALANKETLVVAGQLINSLLAKSDSTIVPVDSEHSAIFQCLRGEKTSEADKIILTASGGPFRTTPKSQLHNVTPEDALRHPNWSMGAKVTIDSASMMNKGFEMIEAHWLFGCPPDKIEIVVHPQSIVHSMVAFKDGSFKAQLGSPDMHIPIRYALSFPLRLPTEAPPMQLSNYSRLSFEAPDLDKFPLLGLAFDAIRRGGTMPCVLNAANEVAVAAFLHGRLRFTDMPHIAADTMAAVDIIDKPSLQDYVDTNAVAVAFANNLLSKYSL